MATHESFICDICSRSFDLRGRYNQHLKTHSKPYGCDFCTRDFGLRADLNRHIKSRHRVGHQKYNCSVHGCDFKATRKDNIVQHFKRIHVDEIENESVSDEASNSRSTHGRAVHQEPTSPSVRFTLQATPIWSLLMESASIGNIALLTALLQAGCPVNMRAEDGSTALHCAARSRQTEVLQLLIDRKANLIIRNKRGNTPLYEAALGGCRDCILLLLRSGASTGEFELMKSYNNPNQPTFLERLARLNDVQLVKDILDIQLPNYIIRRGSKVLAIAIAAAKIGQTEILQTLLESDTGVLEDPYPFMKNTHKKFGPIHWAIVRGQTAAVRLLLTPTKSYKGQMEIAVHPQLLTKAAKKGYEEICTLILDCHTRGFSGMIEGAPEDCSYDIFYESLERAIIEALFQAVKSDKLSVLQILVAHEHGLSWHVKCGLAIKEAFWHDKLNIVHCLLQQWEDKVCNGAIPELETDQVSPQNGSHGETWAQGANEEHDKVPSRVELLERLLQTRILPIDDRFTDYLPDQSRVEKTLLYLTVEHNDLQSVEFLLSHEKFEARWLEHRIQRDGETALDAAQRLGHTEIADLLIAHGAIDHHSNAQAQSRSKRQSWMSEYPDSESSLDTQEANDSGSDFNCDFDNQPTT